MKTIGRVVFAVLVLAFIAGIVSLFQLRFEVGDIYPAYSSLRADPLGVKALYESLGKCCGYTVSRNFEPFEKRTGDTNAAILFLGLQPDDLDSAPEQVADEFDSFVQGGGRLILVYLPVQTALKESLEVTKPESDEDTKLISLSRNWGFDIQTTGSSGNFQAERKEGIDSSLPHEITAHTWLHFSNLHAGWSVLYTLNERPVMMERKVGKGSIFVSTISYFLSNEAMVKERNANLLLHVLGGKRSIFFDEYHHGVSNNPGVAYFIRKYSLGWSVAGVLLLAGLFIWKNGVPFIPREESEIASSSTLGKESAEGLTNLLRRNIAGDRILSVCWEEWKKGRSFFRRGSKVDNNKLERIDSMLKPERTSSFYTYNEISEILKERN